MKDKKLPVQLKFTNRSVNHDIRNVLKYIDDTLKSANNKTEDKPLYILAYSDFPE